MQRNSDTLMIHFPFSGSPFGWRRAVAELPEGSTVQMFPDSQLIRSQFAGSIG